MQLVIGDMNYSSWSMRAWLAAKASGLPFETVRIWLREDDSATRIAQYSPSGRVPCFITGDTTIWDSLAIMEYFAEHVPALWPADTRARAVARSVSAEMHSGFTALRTHMSMNIRKDYAGHGHNPEALSDIARIADIWTDCRRRYGQTGPYLFGKWSIADMMYAPVAMRFRTYGVQPEGEAGRYLQSLCTHPHVEEWVTGARAESHFIPLYDAYG